MWKFVYKINADGSKQPVAKKPNLLLPGPNKCKNILFMNNFSLI